MIRGTTTLIAHIGYPTATFKAPMVYNPYFEQAGIDAVVVPMGVKPDDYPDFLRNLFSLTNIRGALITMPHKVTAVALLDEASPAVRLAGSCNAVRRTRDGRLEGDLFDGEGFVRALRGKGCGLEGARAFVAGAGGVGSAIAAALAAAGAASIALCDPRAGAASALAERLAASYPNVVLATGESDPAGRDVVVNATPLGRAEGDPMPIDVARIAPEAFVGDVVMTAGTTAFVAAAQARGCRVQPGIEMLFEQIPLYLEFFGFPTTTAEQLRAIATRVL